MLPGPVSPRRPFHSSPDEGARDIDRVRHAVTAMLAERAPDIQVVARVLRTSRRTLQRRLRDAGLTYVGLLAETRRQTAERLLEDPARKIADVARALGYSDPAHFTRAFLRWTGVSPRSFRGERGRTAERGSLRPEPRKRGG